jgi:hypothetical protein
VFVKPSEVTPRFVIPAMQSIAAVPELAAVFRLQGPTRPIDVVYGIIGFVGLVAFLRLGYRSWRRRRTPEPVTLTVPDY